MINNNKVYREDLSIIAQLSIPWQKLKNKKILISGASGMMGSFIVDLLMFRNAIYKDNIQIYALSRNEVMAKKRFMSYWDKDTFVFIKHDINNKLPNIGEIDFIIHAASNTHPVAYSTDPIGTIMTNILGTYNLLYYSSIYKVKRFVFLSSVEIYGENRRDIHKFDETYCGYIDCNTLRAGYPESKRAGEALCNAFRKQYGIDFVIPRLCRVYGPTMLQSDSKAIAQFIRNAVKNQDIILKSKGEQYYSYCYVADAVSGILYILLYGKSGEVYNISDTNSEITLKDLADKIARIVGTKVIYSLPDEKELAGFSKATKAILDNSKLKNLGWSPQFNLDVGLSNTINILKFMEDRQE